MVNVVVASGDAVVDRTLELLLESADYGVGLAAGSLPCEPGVLEGVDLLLLAPGLTEEQEAAVLSARAAGARGAARVPVVELVPVLRGATGSSGRRLVSWPCRAEELERQIGAALGRAPGPERTKRGEKRMIRIRLEVGDEGTEMGVTVQAESISQALKIASGVFPSSELRVPFPLDPDGFFVRDGSAPGLVAPEGFEREAG